MSDFIVTFPSFLCESLVKVSLPTTPLLQLFYIQNDITFTVVLTLTFLCANCQHADAILRQQKVKGSDLAIAHA